MISSPNCDKHEVESEMKGGGLLRGQARGASRVASARIVAAADAAHSYNGQCAMTREPVHVTPVLAITQRFTVQVGGSPQCHFKIPISR